MTNIKGDINNQNWNVISNISNILKQCMDWINGQSGGGGALPINYISKTGTVFSPLSSDFDGVSIWAFTDTGDITVNLPDATVTPQGLTLGVYVLGNGVSFGQLTISPFAPSQTLDGVDIAGGVVIPQPDYTSLSFAPKQLVLIYAYARNWHISENH